MKTEGFALADWLHYLENRPGDEIQLGLTRVRQVAQALKLCSLNSKIVTVAGTNGKGSTVSALEALYCAAGYGVGTYTSPHLMVFNERIRVNQRHMTDDELCDAF